MAKKLRRPKTSLRLLFIELLIPWVVMGLVAAIMSLVFNLPDYASILIALASALFVTLLIRDYERKRRMAGSR